MTDDPWKNLKPPSSADALNARRVDAEMPWGFFWARGTDRRCLLLLRHAAEATPPDRLPRLKGVETTFSGLDSEGRDTLVLRLLDTSQRDIFHRLCLDIMASASTAKTEVEAVSVSLARTWRWHHLLRGGGDGRLSKEEQKGLIGELVVMERLLENLSPHDAVSSWRGPLGAPKDFEIGRCSIEAKARRGAAKPHVLISSEHQLDTSGVDELFLFIAELDQAQSDAADGFTITDIARRLYDDIAATDNEAAGIFESLLCAAGFSWDDDYSDTKWLRGPERYYQVSDGFPCITIASFPAGVLNVRYSVSLAEIEPFRVAGELIDQAVSGGKGDN
ncbi:MAG: PD-(D/E)XK motif protein [Parasphingorhabdus sp.]